MIRSFQWDLARQVERLDWLLAQLPRYAEWGYQELHLHLEDAVDYPSLPAVARRDAYSHRQMGQLVDAAARVGIRVVPIVNLLGHTQYLIKVPELRDLNELRAADGSPLERGQICPLHPRTLEVAEKLLRDVAPFCTAGKVHVGLDESFHLGKHPLSRREIARVGLAAHFARHVRRLRALTRELGLQMGMWADMLYFLPEAIPLLPRDLTAYEWYYYAFTRRPRVELFNFAEADLATPLQRHGIELYGCPMNGAFRYEPLPHFADRMNNIVAWWRYARRVGAKGFLVSSWEPYRLAIELTTAVDAAAAGLWLEPEIADPREMLARGFERVFGRKGRAAARIALACDKYPFSGYAGWQTNDRWDTVSRRSSAAGYRAEERHFARLARKARVARLPIALQASVQFRSYLATRDRCVRDSDFRNAVWRPALNRGVHSARVMWARTRDPRLVSPNESIVRADAQRLRAAQRGSAAAGQWQLCYRVWNFAPALQLVGVEQQTPDGSWRVLQSCHTIEFRAIAARRRANVVREQAAPVAWDGGAALPRLRIFVRGLGEVKVGAIELRGPSRVHGSGRKAKWHRIGQPAPARGWPALDWVSNSGVLELEFSR
ncbi:MAG TPA: family 20 glycosylhydrolase [Opitutus sp.]|nr:family 20 glycosylhydrolase [Opitutus sp.]